MPAAAAFRPMNETVIDVYDGLVSQGPWSGFVKSKCSRTLFEAFVSSMRTWRISQS